MTGEGCKFLHPAICRKYMENPEEVAEHNAKVTIQNFANILRPQGNVTTIDASEYISRAQGASKPHHRSRNQVKLLEQQIKNRLWSPHKIWLTTTHPAPSSTHFHTPRNISPPIRLPFHCTLIPHHSVLSLIQPAHPQPLLNPFILLKHPHSHHKHIILCFPALSSHLNPTPHTSIPRMCTREWHKGANLRMTIYVYGKWCTMYNNNWTTWCLWWVQLQLPGANQLKLNNQLQHPGTRHKETKAQSTIDNWIGNYRNAFIWKNTWLRDTNEELDWISCRSNHR